MEDYSRDYMTAWGYVGYNILFAIPLVGFILLIVFSLSNENINRRNYARSILLTAVLTVVLSALGISLL